MFFPPNIVLGLKIKMSPKIILGPKKFWVQKNFGSRKIVGPVISIQILLLWNTILMYKKNLYANCLSLTES